MPPNPMGAAQTLAGASDPALQQAGIGMIGKQMEAQMPQRPPNPQEMAFKQQEAEAKRQATESAAGMASADRLQREQAARQQQGDMARLTASLRQPQQPRQPQAPVSIVGPDGKALLVPPEQSYGKQPFAGSPGARQAKPMSATVQKELIQTEEEIEGARSAIGIIKQAETINEKAMGFTGAGAVASAGTLLPNALKPKPVDATINLDNLIQGSALPQLKSIFGGMPTEGERAILLELQGSSSKPASVRKDIFKRAIQAAERRVKFGSAKAKQLRAGSYFQEQAEPAATGGGVDDLLEKYK